MLHPFFDPNSMYGRTILEVIREGENGEEETVRRFFEELRLRILRRELESQKKLDFENMLRLGHLPDTSN